MAEFYGIVSGKWLVVSSSAPRSFASSLLFPEKFWFCTDNIGSVELLDLVPRLQIDSREELARAPIWTWTRCLHFFLLFADSCHGLRHTVLLELSSCWCGMQVGKAASWKTDVGDVRELVDKQKTAIGNLIRGFITSAIFDDIWFLTTGPLVGITMVFTEFSEWVNGWCIFEKLYCHE